MAFLRNSGDPYSVISSSTFGSTLTVSGVSVRGTLSWFPILTAVHTGLGSAMRVEKHGRGVEEARLMPAGPGTARAARPSNTDHKNFRFWTSYHPE